MSLSFASYASRLLPQDELVGLFVKVRGKVKGAGGKGRKRLYPLTLPVLNIGIPLNRGIPMLRNTVDP